MFITRRILYDKLVAIEGLALRVLAKLDALSHQGDSVMAILDDLEAQVRATTDVEASAIVLMQGLSAKLDAAIAANDPARIAAVAAALKTSTASLSAAIVANTPAAPAAPKAS